MVEVLRQGGFPIPDGAGTPICFPKSRQQQDNRVNDAWRACSGSCAEVIDAYTSTAVDEVRRQGPKAQRSSSWRGVAKWYACVILAAVTT